MIEYLSPLILMFSDNLIRDFVEKARSLVIIVLFDFLLNIVSLLHQQGWIQDFLIGGMMPREKNGSVYVHLTNK